MLEDANEVLADLTDRSSKDYEPARRSRSEAPSVDYEPGRALVTMPPMETLADEDAWRTAIESVGIEVPEGWRVRVVKMTYDPAAWHRDRQDEDAVTRPVWRYVFAVEEDPARASNVDELVKEIGRTRPLKKDRGVSDGTLVVAWNDWQLFKAVGDGVEGTVRRILDSFDVVTDRAKELRKIGRRYNRLVVVASGDIVEGCQIYPHQSWELQGDSRDQENAGRRLIVRGLKHFSRHFDEVRVLVVGGNHGENRIDGKRINRHDNADVKVFEQAADILSESPAFEHVTFHIPKENLAGTISVEGWVLGTTHGHIAGKQSGSPEAKIYNWYKGQAAGKMPAGDADVLVTSHYHHPRMADWGGCLWLQAPAMDGGSPQFSDITGMDARAGLLTFGITPTERVRDLEVTHL